MGNLKRSDETFINASASYRRLVISFLSLQETRDQATSLAADRRPTLAGGNRTNQVTTCSHSHVDLILSLFCILRILLNCKKNKYFARKAKCWQRRNISVFPLFSVCCFCSGNFSKKFAFVPTIVIINFILMVLQCLLFSHTTRVNDDDDDSAGELKKSCT